ncbi:MAG: hypothetical protein CW338_02115 [Clostridiales bacterium]|nr:hypothetical protein [Clostridiales bacterium]
MIMLNNVKTMELNENELMNVNGGNWLTDAWDATCDWCSEHKKDILIGTLAVGGLALACTGLGVIVAGSASCLIGTADMVGVGLIAAGACGEAGAAAVIFD